MHLQFAYYESSLVVEFLIDRFGVESLKRLLRDLAADMPINDAIARHTGMPLERLDLQFEEFAQGRAKQLAPKVDWERRQPSKDADATAALKEIVENHPTNFWALLEYSRQLISQERFADAIEPLRRAIDLFPEYTAADNHYSMLATVYRRLGEAEKERSVLERLAAIDGDAVAAFGRLMALAAEANDWKALARNAERQLAVNPLLAEPHKCRARAAEALGDDEQAIESYRTMLRLEPANPAEVHFSLAGLLESRDRLAAKTHVIRALEEAPRFRDAHRMLLRLHRAMQEDASADKPSAKATEIIPARPTEGPNSKKF
jgi:tetratricopeptide (TPR) repeat protein